MTGGGRHDKHEHGRQQRPATSDAVIELHRAANAVRNHVEQAVLRHQQLTWTGFLVLCEVWAARRLETRHAATAAGIAKATLTGVVDTLVRRDLVRRVRHPDDGRLVLLELTREGQRLARELVPASRAEEAFALGDLDEGQVGDVTAAMRRIALRLDEGDARDRRK